ncbi:unnamed protein product [Ilex paraguariensis]|uniref:Avr9/Cf-9 rapidly elicited protein 137 n=1 Tax=Ilex paraguariensis TaxID=185542 RepID=A0ABC8UWA1_9AQUA
MGVRSLSAESKKPNHLGILAFETAKTMSRLISLYRSLSDEEISKLRKDVMKSEGVAYLNSKDEAFLLSLACAEKLEDLDKAATTVARLGNKCTDVSLNKFNHVYTDFKLGIIDLGKLEYGSKKIDKKVEKMERLILTTSSLYESLEALAELEASERKLMQWKKNCRAIQLEKMNFDLFYQKIANQRKQVRNFRGTSLWSQTFDKSVGLMARLREMTQVQPEFFHTEQLKEQVCSRSGPVTSTSSKPILVRFYSRKSIMFLSEANDYRAEGFEKNNRVFHAAGPSTVGGSGLALRYANVILVAESFMHSAVTIGHDARESLYEMLPQNLKKAIRSKLSKCGKIVDDDESLADGWREALSAIMGWLTPMAHHTVQWQTERNVEKMKFDSKPSELLLQTLHFSDKEKTEAAIVEVLVGLSCLYRYENRRSYDSRRW